MKHYIEYFKIDRKGRYSHPLGNRSIIALDNRLSLASMRKAARQNNDHSRPTYDAYRIIAGADLYEATAITNLIPCCNHT